MPRSRRQANQDFLGALAEQGEALLARGRGVLEGVSDAEWDALLEDDEDEV